MLFFKSFFQSRPLEVKASNLSFLKWCLHNGVANFVNQDRNVFLRVTVRSLEKCVQENWDMRDSSPVATSSLERSASCTLANKPTRVFICHLATKGWLLELQKTGKESRMEKRHNPNSQSKASGQAARAQRHAVHSLTPPARQLRAERPHHTRASTQNIFKNLKKGWVGASWSQRFNSAFVTNILVDPVFVFLDHL